MPHKNPRTLTYQGRTQTIGQWSRELGIPVSTIRSRLDKLHMSDEEALSRPVDERFHPRGGASAQAPRPAPRLTKDSRGRAIAEWIVAGVRRKKVFGKWGDQKAVKDYTRWAAEWIVLQGHQPEVGRVVHVADLLAAYLDHAELTYRKRGKITSEVHGFRAAFRTVNDLYGDSPADRFGPSQLRAVMLDWVKSGKALKTVNDYRNKVVRCWQWGAGQEMVPASVSAALERCEPIAPGRTTAPVSEPVPPANDADVEKILPHLHPDPERCRVLVGMVQLARATGMRPGEVCEIRAEDIDRSREPWLYRPASGGKTFHLEKSRKVWIGPIGRAILAPFLADIEPGKPLFRLPRRNRTGTCAVSVKFLRERLEAACLAVGVEVIRPNQLRHAKATEIHRAYEDDSAVAAALGNSPEIARQVYIDGPADAVARRIAETLG